MSAATSTEREERACELPIRDDPDKLKRFFSERGRQALYGPHERQAIRGVQPAWLYDQVSRQGTTELPPREEESATTICGCYQGCPTSTSTVGCT